MESTKVLHARSATRFSLYSTFAEPWQDLCASPVFTNRAIPCNSTPQTDPSADGKLYERQWDFLHLWRQLSTNWTPSGHCLGAVEDICMFEFVELHCLMLFMFVHLAGTVESSSNNPIPNCEAEGLLHLLILAPSCCPNRCGRSTSAVTSPQVTACHRTAEFGQKIPRRSQHIPATAATYLGSLPNLSKVATAQRLVKL